MFICIGFLMFVVPYLYSFSPTLNKYLKTLDGKAIDVTCAYNKVAILLKDGSVCMIELKK